MDNEFLDRITKIIEDNISNEQFGVSDLASKVNMSRSNLLRKVKKLTNVSVSVYIRQIRLEYAQQLLENESFTVSEVAYKVGFSSPSYFIKCYGDFYGYPPGETSAKIAEEKSIDQSTNDNDDQVSKDSDKKSFKTLSILLPIVLIAAAIIVSLLYYNKFYNVNNKRSNYEKSIAVLPFINDSEDSSNIYIINGLMESILNNLQKIEGLDVVSRTSVEKYRNSKATIPEIAKELNVVYFVEGSGQKIGDEILLTVQLIEGPTDKHLWSEQYNRNTKDIFKLQKEVSKNIAQHIQVVITPDEEKLIDKNPTNNLVAYDYFLKGLDFMHKGTSKGLEDAIFWFSKAINEDGSFARAYADIAISYYYLDIYKSKRQYTEQINDYSDKAMQLDPELSQSLIARALHYLHIKDYNKAVTYLDKSLDINPNDAVTINLLSDIYTQYIPNTEKYLEYALKGVKLDIASYDSTTASYIYLHISNALIQLGFIDEALNYINKSLMYDRTNIYSMYVKDYELYAKNRDLNQLINNLHNTLNMDTTRLDVLQELAKVYYYNRDYRNALLYYKKYLSIKEALNLDIYPAENAKIAYTYLKNGLVEEADRHINLYREFAENDHTNYRYLSLAAYCAYLGETKKALDNLEEFSQQTSFHYWIVLFLDKEPLFESMSENKRYQQIVEKINSNFYNTHKRVDAKLNTLGLLN